MSHILSSKTPAELFSYIQKRSGCLFAKTTTVISAQCSGSISAQFPGRSIRDHIAAIWPEIKCMCDSGSAEAFVLHFRPRIQIKTVRRLSCIAHTVLRELYVADKRGTDNLYKGIETPHWQYSVCGCLVFPSTFASLYPPAHSRSTGRLPGVFILLHKESSFQRRLFCPLDPRGAKARQDIRWNFQVTGQEYNWARSIDARAALKMVHPIEPMSASVRWWKMPYYK